MKKLISLLGALTLTVTAPLSAISCSKSKRSDNENDDFDYNGLKQDFLSEIQVKFVNRIEEDFGEIFYVSKQDSNKNFKEINWDKLIKLATKNKEVNIESSQEEFTKISEELAGFLNWTKFTEDVANLLKENVNYRPLFSNGLNPIGKSKLSVSDITIKNQNDLMITIYFSFKTTIEVLDKKGNLEFHEIKGSTMINQIDDDEKGPTTADLNKLKKEFTSTTISNKFANNFVYESDVVNVMRDNDELAKGGNAKEVFEEVVKEIVANHATGDDSEVFSKFTLSDKTDINIKKEDAQDLFASADSFILAQFKKEAEILLKDAFWQGGDATEVFANTMVNDKKEEFSTWHYFKNFEDEAFKADDNSGVGYNVYSLRQHYLEHAKFSSEVKKKKYEFDLDNEKDNKTLVVSAQLVKNIKVDYTYDDGQILTVNIPNQWTIFRQRATSKYANSKEISKSFFVAMIDFYREFFNMTDKTIENPDPLNSPLTIKKPKGFDDLEPGESFESLRSQYFQTIYYEALERMSKLPSRPDQYIASTVFSEFPKIMVDAENRFYFINSKSGEVENNVYVMHIKSRTSRFGEDTFYGSYLEKSNNFEFEFFKEYENPKYGLGSIFKLVD